MYEISLGFNWYDTELRDEYKSMITEFGLATELRFECMGIPVVQVLYAKANEEQAAFLKLKYPYLEIRKCIE
jgi:hypothetical protein